MSAAGANLKALAGLINLIGIMALALFGPAWTLNYWQAWTFLALFFVSALAITLDLMKHDPKLLERRVQAGPLAEKQTVQKIVQSIASLAFLGLLVEPSLDHRLGWSEVPFPVVILGNVFVALGFLIVFRVFRANSFTSATIEVAAGQKVISTGPYALVRHPMYGGALILLVGMPLALGSWWGLLAVIPLLAVLVWRLLDEEKFLVTNLAGYRAYQAQVRYRLLPMVW